MPIPLPKLALFVAASLALTLTPGPAVLFIVARSISQGRRAGFLSVLGVGLGNTVHAGAAALGLAALLASSPVAFEVVRWLGAAYLVLLGLRRMLDRGAAGIADAQAAGAPAGAGVLRSAVLVAVLNPKTALFFIAFLPQFADAARGGVPGQILFLGVLFVAIAVTTDSAYVLLADGIGAWLRRRPAFARGERWVSGAVYMGLGAVSVIVR